jgi:glycosyltransferase involved in cell wall biosynthesis
MPETRAKNRGRTAVRRLGVIQPQLSNPSREMFLELSQYCPLDVVVSPEPAGQGFRVAPLPQGPRIRYFSGPTLKPFGSRFGLIQWSALRYILHEKPDAIFVNANPRYLTFWLSLLGANARGIPVYAHGHGFYRRARMGWVYKRMMAVLLKLVTGYICYAPIVRQAFLDNGFSPLKLAVAHNSLINRFPVTPGEKQNRGAGPGILFIGRLRRESRLDLLVRVIDRLRREDGLELRLHIVGEGEESARLRAQAGGFSWAIFHGGVYDPERIREISLDCFAGCYPGKAGLSVIHMMSLSLPVITHDDLRNHGPEPSFIRDGIGGWLFDHADPEASLYRALRALASDPAKAAEMGRHAFADYQALAHPSLAERIWAIAGGELHREASPEAAATAEDIAAPASRFSI